MTPSEKAAFNAGVEAMRQMAMIAAITIENRDDAREVRQQAAAAALHGLAEGAKVLITTPMSGPNFAGQGVASDHDDRANEIDPLRLG